MHRHVAIVLAITTSVLATASACPGTSSVPGQDILDLINGKRSAAGCGPVTGDDRLRAAADRHAMDMRDNPAIRSDPHHLGSDGSTPSQRIADAGYAPVSRTGEIMYWASGPPGNTPQASVDWWMNSPTHKAIIETCEFTHAGVGLVYPGGNEWYTTVDFGAQ